MDINIAFLLMLSSLILFLYFLLNKRTNGAKLLNLPPGPPKLPLIGNVHQLAGLLPHRAFRDLARKHGPIMHIQLGQMSAVIISSPRLAKEVFKTRDIALADRPKTFGSDLVLYRNTDIALAPYGEYWRQMKKIASLELLSSKKVQSFGPIREQELHGFMKFLQLSSGKPINIHKTITGLVNNVVCKASFGKNCKHQQALLEFLDEFARVNSGFYVADLFPDFKFLYVVSGLRSKLTKLHKTLEKIFDDIFKEHEGRKRDGEEQEEDLLEVLLRVKEEGGLEFPITNNNIKAIFVDIFAGGTDTSSVTIEWALTEMMRHPIALKRAQAEVREAFKGKTKIMESDIQGLSYLQSVIKETLRLHPPIPMLLPHVCREYCQIDGYDIPVKMKLIVNAWACSTDPEYWDDAESFKPERFENSPVDFMGTNYQFIPFGSGRRMCPGMNFGLITVGFFLAQMLYYFNWELPDGLNPINVDMTETEGLIAAKKDIFAGGTDTSSITIGWAMTELIRHPSVMEKVQVEVRKAFKGKGKIMESDLQGLSYLQSVIKETLRLHPPLPLLLPRVCREQCKIAGYDMPVNMKVFVNGWACSTDPEYWEDAEAFKPERFEDTSIDFMGTNYHFMPFGSGRRMCPGITFGMVSVELFLAQMLYYFNWKLPDGLSPPDIDMTETEGSLLGKKVHLHLIPTSYAPDN